MKAYCLLESGEYIEATPHDLGVLIEMDSPSQVSMGENPSIVLSVEDLIKLSREMERYHNV